MVASRASLVLLLCSILATRNDALQLPVILSSSVTTQAPPSTTTNTKRTTATTIEETQQKIEQEARQAHRRNPFNALFVDLPENPLPQPCVVPPFDNPYHHSTTDHLASQLPTDFPPGAFLRIGPNGAAPDEGFLDGDGFINCITFPPPPPPPKDDDNEQQKEQQQQQSASLFTATYVDTLGRQTERKVAAAGRSNKNNNKNDEKSPSAPPPRYRGTLGGAPRGWPLLRALWRNAVTLRARPQKDTCNTALAFHGDTLLALMEQSRPTVLQAHRDGRVTTIEAFSNLNGAFPTDDPVTGGSLGAHGRTCPLTGERIHVSYSSGSQPYARVDIFAAPQQQQQPNDNNKAADAAAGFQLKRSVPIQDLEVPVMIHDLAITENYVVVLDFPLTIRPGRMIRDQFPVAYEPENGARIGLVPRDNSNNNNNNNAEIRWFEVDPCVVLHTVNAYEDKDNNKVILQALRSVPQTTSSYITSYTTAFLHEWELDLGTAVVREQCLNPSELVEFPAMDDRHHGQSSADYAYCIHVSSIGGPIATLSTPREGILIDGLVKFALRDNVRKGEQKGDVVDRFVLPDQWYTVSEPTVVPKMGNRNNKEDAGTGTGGVYVVMVATHVPEAAATDLERIRNGKTLTSHVLVLDGDNLSAGPVWAAETPQHVAYGLHSEFIPWDKLRE